MSVLSNNGFQIELIENKESLSKTEIKPPIYEPSKFQSFTKVAFKVDNLDKKIKELKKNNVKFIKDKTILKKEKQKFIIIYDNNRNMIQLIEDLK